MTKITLMLPEETVDYIRTVAYSRGIIINKVVTQAIDFLVDTIVDDYAQNLPDHHGYNGEKSNHDYTFSDVMYVVREVCDG